MKSWGKEFYYLVNCWVTSKWNLQDFLGVEGSVKYRSLQMSAKDQLLTKQKIHSDPVWRRVCNRVLYCSLAGSELIALLPQPPECCTYSWWGKGHHTWTQYFLFFKKKKNVNHLNLNTWHSLEKQITRVHLQNLIHYM